MGASDQRPPITGGDDEPTGPRGSAAPASPGSGTSVLTDDEDHQGGRDEREATYADFLGEQVGD